MYSINDSGISSDGLTTNHLSSLVLSRGRGAFMVKADVKEYYRMASVHPQDQYLLRVQWETVPSST